MGDTDGKTLVEQKRREIESARQERERGSREARTRYQEVGWPALRESVISDVNSMVDARSRIHVTRGTDGEVAVITIHAVAGAIGPLRVYSKQSICITVGGFSVGFGAYGRPVRLEAAGVQSWEGRLRDPQEWAGLRDGFRGRLAEGIAHLQVYAVPNYGSCLTSVVLAVILGIFAIAAIHDLFAR